MSEAGYPLIGDTSMWALTLPEWNVLAEGFRVRNERQEWEMNHDDGEGGYQRPKGKARDSDRQMVEEMQADIDAQQGGQAAPA